MEWATAAEAEEKLGRLRQWMEGAKLPAVVLRRVANVAWLSGGCDRVVSWAAELSPITLIVTAARCFALVPSYERDRVVEEDLAGLDWPVEDYPWEDASAYERRLRQLCDSAPGASDVPEVDGAAAEPALRDLRVVLTAPEMDRYAQLGAEVAAVVQQRALDLCPGEHEDVVAHDLATALLARNILPATVLVGADERAARYPHPLPAGAPIRHLALLAVSARRGGLWISCSRLVSFGPLADEERRALHAAQCADAAYIDGSAICSTLGEAFHRGMDAYALAGFSGAWRHHHQGGVTGYAAREVRATPESAYPLRSGMAFAWNPWVHGLKSEDTVLTRQNHAISVLTMAAGWPSDTIELANGTSIERPAVLCR